MKRRKRKPQEPLPPPCRECRPNDGAWRKDANGGMERCYCPRGEALSKMRRGRRTDIGAARKPGYDGRMAGAGKESE